jgi:hypothetical protein
VTDARWIWRTKLSLLITLIPFFGGQKATAKAARLSAGEGEEAAGRLV